MSSDIVQAAFEARLTPLVSRIAVIVAEIDGKDRARRFIESCLIDEARGLETLNVGTVLRKEPPSDRYSRRARHSPADRMFRTLGTDRA